MALLIAVKQITTKFNSPTIAYYCGQSYPWTYLDAYNRSDLLSLSPLTQCVHKPSNCSTTNYYRNMGSIDLDGSEVPGYQTYGWMETPASAGFANYPFYSFTVADESKFVNSVFDNPSLPYCSLIDRITENKAIFVVAPKTSDSPKITQAAQELMFYLNSSCRGNYSETFFFFEDENQLDSYTKDKDYDDKQYKMGKVAFAVILNGADVVSAKWDYSIRANWTIPLDEEDPTVACLYDGCKFTYTVPATDDWSQFDFSKPPFSDHLFGYSYSGFLTLQQTVDRFIFSFYNSNHVKTAIRASMGLMPEKQFDTDDFQVIIKEVLGIFYMLSYLYPVSCLIRSLVVEKELRIKEGMKMMGLTDMVYNLSWFLTTFLQFTLISALITLVTYGTIFQYSSPFYVFVFFETFSLTVIMLCFLMASCFSRSKTASLLGPMVFFATFFPYYAGTQADSFHFLNSFIMRALLVVNEETHARSSKVGVCFLAPACFALGANVMLEYESNLIGVQASNVDEAASNFTYNLSIGMMWVDFVIYGLLAWYLDKVLPSEFGTPLPFYFPLLPSYWFGVRVNTSSVSPPFGLPALNGEYRRVTPRKDGESKLNDEDLIEKEIVCTDGQLGMEAIEDVSPDLRQQNQEGKCISIRALRKVFKSQSGGDDKVAVKHLDLEMYQNQCTVLLGHNGAGKTTTIGMLVGMISPSDGTAIMPGGLDINTEMAAIRRNLGVCPQHDILFPDLTALQHLEVNAFLFS